MFAQLNLEGTSLKLVICQAKESTNIPNDVYDQIICEIKKERIKDISNKQRS